MRIYLDDERPTPQGWVSARWPEDVINLLIQHQITHISLDHDLGDDSHGTGYDVLLWLEQAVAQGYTPPIITIHSANPPAKARMEAAVASIMRIHAQRSK